MPKLAGRATRTGTTPASSGTVRRGYAQGDQRDSGKTAIAADTPGVREPADVSASPERCSVEDRPSNAARPQVLAGLGGVAVPSVVLPLGALGAVAVDTETNGLYADDGARTAIVSVAWWSNNHTADVDGLHASSYCYASDCVEAYSFPFDQGVRDKPGRGKRFQLDLFQEDDINLPESEWWFLQIWLRGQQLVMQNAPFDLEKLRVGTRHWNGYELEDFVVWDTQLGNKELDPKEPTGLKPTCERLFGDTSDEQAALKPYLGPKDDPRFDLVPWDVIEPYATQDAVKTLRLAAMQRDRIYG